MATEASATSNRDINNRVAVVAVRLTATSRARGVTSNYDNRDNNDIYIRRARARGGLLV